ncbi:MAG TPA: putative zinc-binding protein [bacterium]|nr:putative zinc-binding protein [bacterium]
MRQDADELPLVYSCSGCSSAAQMANDLAVRLDREGKAEMSCIAGVGGDVPSLVKVATTARDTGRPILAIDGCPLECVKHSLARHDIEPDEHYILSKFKVRKRYHQDYDPEQAEKILKMIEDNPEKNLEPEIGS